jgi:virulence-associated protein VagC
MEEPTMVKMLKCKVKAEKLMIEVFDKTGKPKTYKTTNGAGKSITKIEQQILKKGAEVALPEDRIKVLGNAVELVLAPVAASAEDMDDDTATDAGDEAETTVADQIPKK